jgi:hypothetical protein
MKLVHVERWFLAQFAYLQSRHVRKKVEMLFILRLNRLARDRALVGVGREQTGLECPAAFRRAQRP